VRQSRTIISGDANIHDALRPIISAGHADAIFVHACPKCFAPAPHAIGYFRSSNGALRLRGYCKYCSDTTRKRGNQIVWITGDLRQPEDLNAHKIPVVKDNVDTNTFCARCGTNEGVEQHHWAPRSVFRDDYDMWPTSNLCRSCHSRWHQTTGIATGRPSLCIARAPWEAAA